ncbi:hypothetical protein K8I28_04645 [bacterium]|nr:hypothetical protein [bacterium]
MSFKMRNTLILLLQVLVVSGIAVYLIFFHYTGRIEAMERHSDTLDSLLVTIPDRENYLRGLQDFIEQKRLRLENFDREVHSSMTLADAFEYLDEVQNEFGSLKFNLESVKEVRNDGYGYQSFKLAGIGTYRAIMGVIFVLERGPKIFFIDKLTLHGMETQPGDEYEQSVMVPFELTIRAMFADLEVIPSVNRSVSSVDVPTSPNIFYPIIKRSIPLNKEGLIDVEQAQLRALLADKAIVVDQKGKVHSLKEGDRVYLGYLTSINKQKNNIEFTLNKGGIVERFTLNLSFTSTNN